MIVELLILLLPIVFLLCKFINKIKGLPPGPTPLPIIGNILSLPFGDAEHRLLALEKQYGPVFTLWLPYPTVIISNHEAMKRTIVRDGDAYGGRPSLYIMELLLGGDYGLVFEKNEWVKSQRRFALHTLRDLGMSQQTMKDTINLQATQMCDRLRKLNGEPAELRKYFTHGVGNVISQLVFGLVREEGDAQITWFQNMLYEVLDSFSDPKIFLLDMIPPVRHIAEPLGIQLKKATKANDRLVEYLTKIVMEHKEVMDYEQTPTNFIDAYLYEIHRRENEGNQEEFTIHQLVVAIYDMYSAGFETIVGTLRFASLYALNYPQAQKKMHEEIDGAIGKDTTVTMDDQRLLPYTCAFLQETYRMGYTFPFALMRMTMQDVDCEGYHVKSGTRVIPQTISSHIDDRLYTRPDYFCPERHLKDGQFVKDEKIQPFSVGKRSCIGEGLARMEVFQFFVTLMQQFRLESDGPIPPAIEVATGTLRSPKPFQMRVVDRM